MTIANSQPVDPSAHDRARAVLDLIADYVTARQAQELATAYGAVPTDEVDRIVRQFATEYPGLLTPR